MTPFTYDYIAQPYDARALLSFHANKAARKAYSAEMRANPTASCERLQQAMNEAADKVMATLEGEG